MHSFTPVMCGTKRKTSPLLPNSGNILLPHWPAVNNVLVLSRGELGFSISGSVEALLVAEDLSNVFRPGYLQSLHVNFVAQLKPDCLPATCLKRYIFLPFPHGKYLVIEAPRNRSAGSTAGELKPQSRMFGVGERRHRTRLAVLNWFYLVWFCFSSGMPGSFSLFFSSMFLKVIKKLINTFQRKKKKKSSIGGRLERKVCKCILGVV